MSETKDNVQIDNSKIPFPANFLYKEINTLSETSFTQETLYRVEKIYDRIQDQIKNADTKAGILLAFNVAIAGFVVSNYEKIIPLLAKFSFLFLFILSNALLATSSVLGLLVFVSRFGGKTPSTKIFWGHISDKYRFDYKKYCEDLCSMSIYEQTLDHCKQITEVSAIAAKKHKYARQGIIAAAISVALAIPLCSYFLYEKHQEYKLNLEIKNVSTLSNDSKTDIKVGDKFRSIISILEGKLDLTSFATGTYKH